VETCAGCGTLSGGENGSTPMTWMVSVENGERRCYCERCTRENVRSVEGRLDQSWW
jgi:hypothetical protein